MSEKKSTIRELIENGKADPEGLKNRYFNPSLTPFERDERMNTLFGNPKGNKHEILWSKVAMKLKVLASEMVETCRAAGMEVRLEFGANKGKPDLAKFLDGLGDTNTVLNGVAHFAGVDLDAIHWAVLRSNLSKFCKDETDATATIEKYRKIGVEVVLGGKYPFAYVKSAKDQMIGDDPCPAGKFLKSVSFCEPDFSSVMEPEPNVLYALESLEGLRMPPEAEQAVRKELLRAVALPAWLSGMQKDGILPE